MKINNEKLEAAKQKLAENRDKAESDLEKLKIDVGLKGKTGKLNRWKKRLQVKADKHRAKGNIEKAEMYEKSLEYLE